MTKLSAILQRLTGFYIASWVLALSHALAACLGAAAMYAVTWAVLVQQGIIR